MFKRANKITSLLVAVAAVMSIAPTGVSAASLEKLKSQDGDFYNAIAYKDGKFYIGGEPKGKDSDAYYLSDGNYSKLKDIDTEDKAEIYGSKYVEVEDGDYYIDLSTGKVTDTKVKEKELDEVSVNLRSNVKSDNDGRYDVDDVKNIKDVVKLPNHKFGEDWYSVEYKTKKVDDTIDGGTDKFVVYTDKSGKYIDADYNIGKIKVKLSSGKTASVVNTSDDDEDVRASVTESKVIGQDSNNIYRLAKITVKSTKSGVNIKEVNGVEVKEEAKSLSANSDKTIISFNSLQVISKDQASKEIDGIKTAKTTTTYALSDKDGKTVDLLNDDETAFTVVDGKIVNYKISGSEVEAELVNLKIKGSVYYIEKGDNDHVVLQDGENSVDIDVNGNLWALSDDNIYKFDNNEDFEKIYDLDKDYKNLSVYDKANLVVWNSEDEIYSIASNKTKTDEPAAVDPNQNATPVTVTAGWVKDSNGKWNYNNADGTKYKGWLDNNGAKYYLEADGTMVTGWKQLDSKWYFLDGSGAMKTGWINGNGTWYYLDGSGIMKTGWIKDNETWYYCNESGAMLSNTTVGGYKLGASGAWIK